MCYNRLCHAAEKPAGDAGEPVRADNDQIGRLFLRLPGSRRLEGSLRANEVSDRREHLHDPDDGNYADDGSLRPRPHDNHGEH
jgi:hypothetical protein